MHFALCNLALYPAVSLLVKCNQRMHLQNHVLLILCILVSNFLSL